MRAIVVETMLQEISETVLKELSGLLVRKIINLTICESKIEFLNPADESKNNQIPSTL